MAERGVASPIRFMARMKRSRSSALSMASWLAPMSSTPNDSTTPSRTRSRAQLSAVCPPIVGNSASGRSASMILATVRHSTGSTYVASAIDGSVMMVAGLEFTSTTR